MNTPLQIRSQNVSRSRFHYWVWVLAILLAACVPVSPSAPTPAPAASGTTGASKVAILVADFFSAPGQLDEVEMKNCLAGPNGYGQTSEGAGGSSGSTGATGDIAATTTISHGELVYAHLIQQFGSGLSLTDMNPGGIDGLLRLDHGNLGNQEIYLAKIDIGRHYTDEVLQQIADVRGFLQGEGVEYFIVNLSVVVKPCTPLFDKRGENFDVYIDFVRCIDSLQKQRILLNGGEDSGRFLPEVDPIIMQQADISAAYFANIFDRESPAGCTTQDSGIVAAELGTVLAYSSRFYGRLGGDPLVQAAQGISGVFPIEDTFFVASAGNDGLPYPYAPAVFRYVVSTGAISGTVPIVNKGEWGLSQQFDWVVEGGEIHLKTRNDNDSVTSEIVSEGQPVTLTGTSFAAPKLSYLIAVALFMGVDIPGCYLDLVYAAKALPEDWDNWSSISRVNPGTIWWNREPAKLKNACPGFPNPSMTTPPSQ